MVMTFVLKTIEYLNVTEMDSEGRLVIIMFRWSLSRGSDLFQVGFKGLNTFTWILPKLSEVLKLLVELLSSVNFQSVLGDSHCL